VALITAGKLEYIQSLVSRVRELDGLGYRDPASDPDHCHILSVLYTELLGEMRHTTATLLPALISTQVQSLEYPVPDDIHAIAEVRGVLGSVVLELQETLDAQSLDGRCPGTEKLLEILQRRDLHAIGREFDRALRFADTDPPSAITAANAMVEAACKAYIDANEVDSPRNESVKGLWNIVRSHLDLEPSTVDDSDLRKMLSGLVSIVEGLGSLRTHRGSAHGKGPTAGIPDLRHARLAVCGASAVVDFVIRTWEARTGSSEQRISASGVGAPMI